MSLLQQSILREYSRRHQVSKPTVASLGIMDSLFPEQHAFITSPADLAIACCTRRAGKSESCGRFLASTVTSKKGANCLYIGLTRRNAKNIMPGILKKVFREYKVEYEYNRSDMEFELPNESLIQITGAGDHVSDIAKLLGSSYDLIIIDEAQSFPEHLKELIYDVLLITIAERQGKIRMIGTPGIVAAGFFYDVFTGAEKDVAWSRHTWSWKDNPFNRTFIQKQVDKLLSENPKIAETPAFRRNYLGEWTPDTDHLCYRYGSHNLVPHSDIPDLHHYVLGVDLGFSDDTAFVVIGWHPQKSDTAYVVYTYSQQKMIPYEIAEHIKWLQSQFNIIKTVVDEGGLGKSIAEEWRVRYLLNVTPAQKTQKRLYIEELNGALQMGQLKVSKEAEGLVHEWRTLVWLDDSKKVENPACDNHLADSCLYAFREARPFLYMPQVTVDPFKQVEDDLLKRALKNWKSGQFDPDNPRYDYNDKYDI